LLANQGMTYLATGTPPGRIGNAHPSIVPYQVFRTADSAMILACGNDNLFRKFCDVAARPDIAGDPRFAKNADRVKHRREIVAVLGEVMSKRTTGDWVAALEAAGVPCGPINDIAQALAEPQAEARGMKVRLQHPLAGEVPLIGSPMKFSGTPIRHEKAPPVLGQHTDEILEHTLGMSAEERARLRASGALG
jgi:crotonobetainyl-CoA:carnitine CoA-transferase CaiB-like acyl-CoA transferase